MLFRKKLAKAKESGWRELKRRKRRRRNKKMKVDLDKKGVCERNVRWYE